MTDNSVQEAVSFRFDGQCVLVTGAGRGVGEAIARRFHRSGAKVVASDMDADAAQRVAQSLDASGRTALGLGLDVRELADFERARDRMLEQWGRIDVVVNNAGHAKRTPVQDISVAEFDDIVAINMRSVFLSCQVFGEHLRTQGRGRIVNVTSLAGQNGGTVASAHYAAAKAGANMLTKYFAQHLAGTGVTVNAVCPGPLDSAKGRLSAEQISTIAARVPVGRFGTTEEMAAAVAFLASEQGGFFLGATLDLNGGLLMR